MDRVGRVAGDSRPAPCDQRLWAKSATSDPRPQATLAPCPARTYPARPGHTRPDPDIPGQDRTFVRFGILKFFLYCNISECLPSSVVNIYRHVQLRFETNVFSKAGKESNYHCDGQCPSPILWCEIVNDGFWIQGATQSFF